MMNDMVMYQRSIFLFNTSEKEFLLWNQKTNLDFVDFSKASSLAVFSFFLIGIHSMQD